MRVFLDANIIFSASNRESNLYRLFGILYQKTALITSHYALEEARRNIILKRNQWENTFQEISSKITLVSDVPLYEKINLVEKDRPILGSAIESKCNYLLTADKRDFGHLYNKTIKNVMIVDCITMAEIALNVSEK